MAKKAIYFDARERELACLICDWVCFKSTERLGREFETDVAKPATKWFYEEVRALRTKFEEPSISTLMEVKDD